MSKIDQQAAEWFVRVKYAEPGDPDHDRLKTWLSASPAHQEAYATQMKLWGQFETIADTDALADRLERRQNTELLGRRRFLRRSTFGIMAIGAVGSLVYRHWRDWPLWQAAFETGIGQIGPRSLQDGSTLVLGGDTAVRVAFSRGARSVWLTRGTAIFEVKRDADRPFVVTCGPVRVTVLGTLFAVTHFTDKVRVSLDHGRIALATGPFWNRDILILEDGQVAEIDEAGGTVMPARRRDSPAANDFAFKQGVIVFHDASLSEIAETLSRYRLKPIRVAPGAAAAPPLNAVAHLTNIEGFLGSLPRIFPVILTEQPGQTLLGVRQ